MKKQLFIIIVIFLTISSYSAEPIYLNHYQAAKSINFIDFDNIIFTNTKTIRNLIKPIKANTLLSNEYTSNHSEYPGIQLAMTSNVSVLHPIPNPGTKRYTVGRVIWHFFLGAAAGAAAVGIAAIIMAGEPEGPPAPDSLPYWFIGGAAVGGLVFAITWP